MPTRTERVRRGPSRLLALAISALVALSGLVTVPATANALVEPATVTPTLTSITDGASLTASVSVTGLPVETTSLYAALVVKGVDPSQGYTGFALPFPTASAGASSFSLTATVAGSVNRLPLVKGAQYEVVVWKLHTAASEATIYGRADLAVSEAEWNRLFPPKATTTSLNVSASAVEVGSAIVLSAQVAPAGDGTVEFFDNTTSLGTAPVAAGSSGTVSVTLPLGAHTIRAVFTPTDASALLGSESAATTVTVTETETPVPLEPRVQVLGSVTDLDPAATNVVTVRGSGFLPNPPATSGANCPPLNGSFAGTYVAFGSYADAWKPSTGAAAATRVGLDVKWAVPLESLALIGGSAGGGIQLHADGTFETTLTLRPDETKALANGSYGIVTYAGDGAKYAPFETVTPVTFATPNTGRPDGDGTGGGATPSTPGTPAPTPSAPAQSAGSLTWGISSEFAVYTTDPSRPAKGSIETYGVGGGRGAWTFPQASAASWNAATQTGTVQYSGTVTFTGHRGAMVTTFSNPVISVTSATTGTISASGRVYTLNLAAAAKSVGANGEVTWAGVPVIGALSGGSSDGSGGGTFGMDPLTFTVGAASAAQYGATRIVDPSFTRMEASAPPARNGITLVTPAEDLVPGGEIEFEASGFQPNERNILVVLYSDPIVLDRNAGANADGSVRWIGTLPADIEPGAHTITLQGSINAGAPIIVNSAKVATTPDAAQVTRAEGMPTEAQAAGIAIDNSGPSWGLWVGAIALLAVAGALTSLVIVQRRRALATRV